MSEKLSQNQIDALLGAVQSGEKELEQLEQRFARGQYSKYDFGRPKKLGNEQLRLLSSILENYARGVNTRLDALLHTNCQVEVDSVEQHKYHEFASAVNEEDVLTLADVELAERPLQEPMVMHFTTTAMLGMIDHMLGGEGETVHAVSAEYSYTALELQMYQSLAEEIISLMSGSWEEYIPVTFRYARTELNPTLVKVMEPNESVVIVDIKLCLPKTAGRIKFCLPEDLLVSVFSTLNRGGKGAKHVGEDQSEGIMDTLRDSDMEIVASLGSTQLTMRDIYHLNVGDVINLSRPKDSSICLEIGGYQWFSGRMGVFQKNMAVKIDQVCYQTEQRSE